MEKQRMEGTVEERTVEVPDGEASLLREVIKETKIKEDGEGYDAAVTGLRALVERLASSDGKVDAVSNAVVDQMIAELDKQIGLQIDEILHHEKFQKLESAWRGLKFLVDRTDFRENIKMEFLNAGKDDLREDFEDSPEVVQSGLYKIVYAGEYGQFGGTPYGALVGNYDFGPGSGDLNLLKNISAVCAMAHAPFVTAAAPSMFALESFTDFPKLKDLSAIFESPEYARWNSLREAEDSRHVCLTLPRFLLRRPYGRDSEPVKGFDYNETVTGGHESYLWGNAAFAFASRLTESFAKHRWCANIIGPKGGGRVAELPVHVFEEMGGLQSKIPTEILLSERKEFELSETGFVGLTMRKGSDNAAFFSANSIQRCKVFPNTTEGKEAETNYRLSMQLPYMSVVNRLAHYIKVIQRENIGLWKNSKDLQQELNAWIGQYVADMDNPMPEVRSRRPLRQAEIIVADVEGDPGWYKVELKVKPHFKFMGTYFTLSLVGKLDKQ